MRPNIYPYTDQSQANKQGFFSDLTLSGNLYISASAALTAFATGGQTNATRLASGVNYISTVANVNDSVMLPSSGLGEMVLVYNSTANQIQVYGNSTGSETVNGGSSVFQPGLSVVVYVCPLAGQWFTVGLGQGFAGSLPTVSSATGIVPVVGGGQANATQLGSILNHIGPVASNGDSVKLPSAVPGVQIVVINSDATHATNVFPSSGQIINALSADTAISVPATKTMVFFCAAAGLWNTLVSA